MISRDYRTWIASLGCAVDASADKKNRACMTSNRVDAAHTGPHAYGRKASDFSCIPLCRRHHAEFDANPTAFQEKYDIDVPALVEALNAVGLPGLAIHRPARKVTTHQFVQTRCICGWGSGWFRLLQDAQQSLHHHLADAEKDGLVRTTQRVVAVEGAAG